MLIASMFDGVPVGKSLKASRGVAKEISFYTKNQDIFKLKLQEKNREIQAALRAISGRCYIY